MVKKYFFLTFIEFESYVLNFNGRANVEDNSNFQLMFNNEPGKQLLQMGKQSEGMFCMDLTYPLSPLIAFGVCLANLDNKFAIS